MPTPRSSTTAPGPAEGHGEQPSQHAWGYVYGPNLPFLERVKELVVAAFVCPELFHQFVRSLPPSTRQHLVEFGAAVTAAMSDAQRAMFRRVVLGLDLVDDGKSSEYRTRKGGLIANDLELLKAFLLSEVNLAVLLDGRLQNRTVRAALQQANDRWTVLHPVDDAGHAHLARGHAAKEGPRPAHAASRRHPAGRGGAGSVGRPRRDGGGPAAVVAPTAAADALSPHLFSAPAPRTKNPRFHRKRRETTIASDPPTVDQAKLTLQTEQRVVWLQLLSWKLKYNHSGYAALLAWRDGVLEALAAFLARAKKPKATSTKPSYWTVGSGCRSRLCLCSPQLSPVQARTLYQTVVADALAACEDTALLLRRRAGILRKVLAPSPKCELPELLAAAAAGLEGLAVSDLKLPHHVSYAGDVYGGQGAFGGVFPGSGPAAGGGFGVNPRGRGVNPDLEEPDQADAGAAQARLIAAVRGHRRSEGGGASAPATADDASSQDEG